MCAWGKLSPTDWQTFSQKAQRVNSLDFASHAVSVRTTQFCLCRRKAAILLWWIPTKLHLQMLKFEFHFMCHEIFSFWSFFLSLFKKCKKKKKVKTILNSWTVKKKKKKDYSPDVACGPFLATVWSIKLNVKHWAETNENPNGHRFCSSVCLLNEKACDILNERYRIIYWKSPISQWDLTIALSSGISKYQKMEKEGTCGHPIPCSSLFFFQN